MTHDDLVAAFGALLAPDHTLDPNLPGGAVTVNVGPNVLPGPIIAIPDVHIGDGGAGDIFANGTPSNVTRLEAVLRAVDAFLAKYPSTYAVQLGDWFDVWRTSGHDVVTMDYGDIQNAAAYKTILDLDAKIGLQHLIGNHDASFLNALPDMRASQPHAFRLGAWLGPSVYTMHGHQTDVTPPENSSSDEFFVAVATALATFIPGVTTFEAYVDRGYGLGTVIGQTLLHALRYQHDDPPPIPRPRDTRPPPTTIDQAAPYAVRESADVLATIVKKVADKRGSSFHPRLLIVGHSHNPCVAWSDAAGAPLVIVDAGGWVYGQSTLLLGAGDRVSVFSVT